MTAPATALDSAREAVRLTTAIPFDSVAVAAHASVHYRQIAQALIVAVDLLEDALAELLAMEAATGLAGPGSSDGLDAFLAAQRGAGGAA
jgi:hypothetical protein